MPDKVQCPRCEKGTVDMLKRAENRCWWCSNYAPCVECPSCGLKICDQCMTKGPQKFAQGDLSGANS